MKLLSDFDLLILPGTGNSDPAHWQSHWCQAIPTTSRVLQDDWTAPPLTDWVERLDIAVKSGTRPAILIGHSRSCSLIAHWATQKPMGRVKGALLVAPSDMDASWCDADAKDFRPMPLARLPFPSVVLSASNDEPFVSLERARHFATCWGSEFVNVGPLGHLNAKSALGMWPDGLVWLGRLVERVSG